MGRYKKYAVKDPSVTEILDVLQKDWIIYWIKSKGFDFAEETRSSTAKIGQGVHNAMEKFLKGYPFSKASIGLDTQQTSMFSLLTEWVNLSDFSAIKVEYEMHSKKLKVKGKLDASGTFNGGKKIVVGDWKTDSMTKTKAQERERIVKYRYQLAGYALLYEHEFGVPIDEGFIVRVTKDNPPIRVVYKFNGEEYENLKSAKKNFKALRRIFKDVKGK